jgi:uncharacterized protein (DUF2267 family)
LEDADLKARYPDAVESYIPIVIDGAVVGAYDLYQDVSPFEPMRFLVRVMTSVGAQSGVDKAVRDGPRDHVTGSLQLGPALS